jgi:predicted O-linked N-acetylglucosamine transferase (SPINDLY family)
MIDPSQQEAAFNSAKLHFLAGLSAMQDEKWTQAEAALKQSLSYMPGRVSTLINLSTTLLKLKKYEEAAIVISKILAQDASNPEALLNEGILYFNQEQFSLALARFDSLIAVHPGNTQARLNRALVLQALGQWQEALIELDHLIAMAPDNALKPQCSAAYINLGDFYRRNKSLDLAVNAYEKALGIDPRAPYIKGKLLHAKMLGCDWTNLNALRLAIDQGVQSGEQVVEPFAYQAIASSEALLSACAKIFSQQGFPPRHQDIPRLRKKEKIHIGYLCGEFRDQATSILMTRVYELHNRDRFKIVAFDNGFDDGSHLRRRISNAFDDMVDISLLSDAQALIEIQKREIDILINLNGFFGLARPNLFAMRPSPIQVNYLGFPGTIGAPYMDYLLADDAVIPVHSQRHYSENIVYLPNSYQANDDKRTISSRRFSRAELGLPNKGFVFCCFNNNYKITPDTFAGWMRILQQVDGSVLWLFEDNPVAAKNLRLEASRSGVAAERLIFAKPLPASDHLARHALADLFLDTLPYNAHTTASDCLWTGLPLITCTGQTFPGRVASSLLMAIGLPELIVNNQQQYEDKAVWLARNPSQLQVIRQKMANNIDQHPLFNSTLFTHHLERAYSVMVERYHAGQAPQAFTVPDESVVNGAS